MAARAKDPKRYGSGSDYWYPCFGCSEIGATGAVNKTNSTLPTSAWRFSCNAYCKANMYPMARGEPCDVNYSKCATGSCKTVPGTNKGVCN